VPRVREIHNLNVVTVDGASAVSLHLKLPADLSLEEAHTVATEVERAIEDALPEVESVQTHLEPLAEATEGRSPAASDADRSAQTVIRVVREATGQTPRALRLLRTPDGLVAFLTLGLDPRTPLAEAHARASEIEERIRRENPEFAEIIVHTEP
jgi:divalent metal cation (Fe/Co/Zn/Cd) transporter